MKQEQKRKRISKRMKELRGKLRQKTKGGNYYYRLTYWKELQWFYRRSHVIVGALQIAVLIVATYPAIPHGRIKDLVNCSAFPDGQFTDKNTALSV